MIKPRTLKSAEDVGAVRSAKHFEPETLKETIHFEDLEINVRIL
jgi:hypothetical protein